MENNTDKNGYFNRKHIKLPNEKMIIDIIVSDIDGEKFHKCEWIPFKKEDYNENNQPTQGFLGTAVIIEGKHAGNGYHAWDQNDSEFIYYKF